MKKGSGTDSAKHPEGRSGYWFLTPFSGNVNCGTVPSAPSSGEFGVATNVALALRAETSRPGEPCYIDANLNVKN